MIAIVAAGMIGGCVVEDQGRKTPLDYGAEKQEEILQIKIEKNSSGEIKRVLYCTDQSCRILSRKSRGDNIGLDELCSDKDDLECLVEIVNDSGKVEVEYVVK